MDHHEDERDEELVDVLGWLEQKSVDAVRHEDEATYEYVLMLMRGLRNLEHRS